MPKWPFGGRGPTWQSSEEEHENKPKITKEEAALLSQLAIWLITKVLGPSAAAFVAKNPHLILISP